MPRIPLVIVTILALANHDDTLRSHSAQVLGLSQSTAGQTSVTTDVNPLFKVLLVEFQKRNPAITRTYVTELRGLSGKQSVVLAWGTTGRDFDGSFEDELHGVFLVDANLTRVERVIDVVPTPRWGDYRFWIEAITGVEVIVRGQGGTYGDHPLRRAYVIVDDAMDAIDAAKKIVRLPPAAFRQLPLSVRKRLEADGCQIPQSPDRKPPHNVISGHFASRTQLDWAVLCSVDGDSSVRIFWGGLAGCPEFGRSFRDSGIYALDFPELRWRVVMEKMPPARVRTMAREYQIQLTAPVHDAIEARYCERGHWIDLEVD
jgi:hypothetical protein